MSPPGRECNLSPASAGLFYPAVSTSDQRELFARLSKKIRKAARARWSPDVCDVSGIDVLARRVNAGWFFLQLGLSTTYSSISREILRLSPVKSVIFA
jgi:hypothetical protein